MIEWLKNDPKRLLLTFSHAEENRLKREYPELSTRIFDWRSYQQRYMHGSQVKEIAIDNADLILQEQFRQKISWLTITDELEKQKRTARMPPASSTPCRLHRSRSVECAPKLPNFCRDESILFFWSGVDRTEPCAKFFVHDRLNILR